MSWIYQVAVKSEVTNGVLVWRSKVETGEIVKNLLSLQRSACLYIVSVIKSTSTLELETLLQSPPLDLIIRGEARFTRYRLPGLVEFGGYRLQLKGMWAQIAYGNGMITNTIANPTLVVSSGFELLRTLITLLFGAQINFNEDVFVVGIYGMSPILYMSQPLAQQSMEEVVKWPPKTK